MYGAKERFKVSRNRFQPTRKMRQETQATRSCSKPGLTSLWEFLQQRIWRRRAEVGESQFLVNKKYFLMASATPSIFRLLPYYVYNYFVTLIPDESLVLQYHVAFQGTYNDT